MKLSISRETLLKNLRHVQSVVEKKAGIAILSNVRLRAVDNRLELTATNNEITMQGVSEAFVEQEGVTTVSAQKFFDIVAKVPEGSMVGFDLSPEGDRLIVTAGRGRFSLACLNADAFPDMTRLEDGAQFKISGRELRRVLGKVAFAVSTEETRQNLAGVYVHVQQGETPTLRFVATDGHRLARLETPLPEGAEDVPSVIIPRKTVSELRKIAEDAEDVIFRLSERKIQAEAGSIVLTSKLIDASYPDYERVIPQENTLEMDVSRQQLMQAVERVSILSHEKSRSVRFSLKKDNLSISANNPDQENALEEVKVDYNADDIDAGFNAKYISDVGAQIEGDDVQFVFKDGSSPVIVRDPQDVAALFVVMPMRV